MAQIDVLYIDHQVFHGLCGITGNNLVYQKRIFWHTALSAGSDTPTVLCCLRLHRTSVLAAVCMGAASLLLQVCYLPLAVVEDQGGGSDLRGLAFLPALEAVESALARLKQGFLQSVQPLHQRRRVLVVGVLGGVHVPSEAADKRLEWGGQRQEIRREKWCQWTITITTDNNRVLMRVSNSINWLYVLR